MESLWRAGVELPRFEPLEGEKRTDVLVIGGGLAGLLCAYFLKAAGVDCLLVEADAICAGVTGNTTAKITAQHGLCYRKLLGTFGPERAGQYLRANLEAVETYRRLCREIPCGFESRPALVYARSGRAKLEGEMEALEKLGYQARWAQGLPLPFPTVGAVEFPDQAQFHPLEFAAGIAKGLPIHEHTRVKELRGDTAVTDHGEIRTKHIIVATHFPFLNKRGMYFLKLYQQRSYVLALEGPGDLGGMYLDEDQSGLSLRNAGGLLLLGGGGHRTGKQGGGWRELREVSRRYYPKAVERYHWAAQDCMSLDGAPYIGPYAKGTPRLYVATGFNKWGMTSAMVAAKLLTGLVLGVPGEYAPLFTPSRGILRPQLAINGVESALNLLTPTAPRCPHLGCALKWNRQERSWDCPCHGSRFTGEGKLLDNPATGGITPPGEGGR